jgi:hypothetical protein
MLHPTGETIKVFKSEIDVSSLQGIDFRMKKEKANFTAPEVTHYFFERRSAKLIAKACKAESQPC